MRSDSKNLYDLLNVSSDAKPEQIKRRYRQLARKYHPDVADNKASAHRAFIEITEAYEILSDPTKRYAYDAELKRELDAVESASARTPSPSQSSRNRTTDKTRPRHTPPMYTAPRSLTDVIEDAQNAIRQKRYGDAEAVIRDALRNYPKNARLHALLGDAYKAEKMINAAIKSYSYAVQFDPYDGTTERKLNALIGEKIDDMKDQEVETNPFGLGFIIVNAISWFAALFLLFMIRTNWGTTFQEALGRELPFGGGLSINVILLTAGASVAVGFVVAANGWLGRTSEEILLESGAGKWAILPTGILAPIISMFWFPIAFIFYCVFGLMQGSLSRSVLVVFFLVGAVIGIGALLYNPMYKDQVMMFCGNLAFPSMIVGWVLGSSITPTMDDV
jgi:curved DNA-binding protein CbpA